MPDALVTDPTSIFGVLAGILALIFWLARQARLEKFFALLPPVIWAYFGPMAATTVGIIPISSPAYSWITRYMLPLSLFLLMATIDLRAILKLGRLALIMMLVGTFGIVIGGPIAYAVFSSVLPENAWQGLAALSGSWIGGTANLVAIQQSVGAPDSLLGPIIVVDTVVGYGWMGVLLFCTAFQARFDRWTKAESGVYEASLAAIEAAQPEYRPVTLSDLVIVTGVGFVAAIVSIQIGSRLPAVGNPSVISPATWAVLVVVTAGLLLSFTRMRSIEEVGASRIGYLALYLLIASIGARADVRAIMDAPAYMLTGVLWITIHVTLLIIAAKLLKAPLFFVATGSMANVGGAASAPVVAGAFAPALAPVGVLMAVAGYILGIYAALFCAWMLGQLSLIL